VKIESFITKKNWIPNKNKLNIQTKEAKSFLHHPHRRITVFLHRWSFIAAPTITSTPATTNPYLGFKSLTPSKSKHITRSTASWFHIRFVDFSSSKVHWFYLSLTSQVRCFYFACFHSLSSLLFFTDLVSWLVCSPPADLSLVIFLCASSFSGW
jgi:hypothetical protein